MEDKETHERGFHLGENALRHLAVAYLLEAESIRFDADLPPSFRWSWKDGEPELELLFHEAIEEAPEATNGCSGSGMQAEGPRYPEHEKLRAVAEQTQAAGDFLSWLTYERGLQLCGADDQPIASFNVDQLLADWKEIDREAIEREKRAMLDDLRSGGAGPCER